MSNDLPDLPTDGLTRIRVRRAPDWRTIWRVLHDLEYGTLTVPIAKARLELAGLSRQAALFRVTRTLLDKHYEMSR